MSSFMGAAGGTWKPESGQEEFGEQEEKDCWRCEKPVDRGYSHVNHESMWGWGGGGVEWDQKSVETIVLRGIQFTCSRLGGDAQG